MCFNYLGAANDPIALDSADESSDVEQMDIVRPSLSALLSRGMARPRLVDVRMGEPYEGNRPLNELHLDEFVRQFRRADPQFMTHPIIVSVPDEETLEAANNVDNYDWPHVCEVLLLSCQFALFFILF